MSAKGWHASTRVPRTGACVQATDRLDAPRGRRTRRRCHRLGVSHGRTRTGAGGIVLGSTTAASGRTRAGGMGLVLQWESVRGIGDTTKRLETITTRRDSLGDHVFCSMQDSGPAAAVASSSE